MARRWLEDIREKKAMTQADVAKATGMAQPSYCRIERGEVDPRFSTMRKISKVLGFPMMRWLDEEEDQQQAES